mmetsp:Transcript_93796/g.265259  ORF Transcript_93796/g.265259 Transcript_93796/m.265259 type:complete len:238 (+) Transcript_93796:89-802(+)
MRSALHECVPSRASACAIPAASAVPAVPHLPAAGGGSVLAAQRGSTKQGHPSTVLGPGRQVERRVAVVRPGSPPAAACERRRPPKHTRVGDVRGIGGRVAAPGELRGPREHCSPRRLRGRALPRGVRAGAGAGGVRSERPCGRCRPGLHHGAAHPGGASAGDSRRFRISSCARSGGMPTSVMFGTVCATASTGRPTGGAAGGGHTGPKAPDGVPCRRGGVAHAGCRLRCHAGKCSSA